MIYLDSSALLKLLWEEQESMALEAWLSVRVGTPRISSELAKVEVMRACRRIDVEALPEARALLDGLHFIPMSTEVVRDASELSEPLLRSLDAIHLASALLIRADLSDFVAYDHRLVKAADAAGLESRTPGAATASPNET